MSTTDEEKINSLQHLVVQLLNNKEWQHALVIGDYLADLTPEDSRVHHCVGIACFNMGNLKKSEKSLQCARKFGDNSEETLLMLAKISFRRGDLDEAVTRAKIVIEKDPDNINARFLIASAYLGKGHLHESREALSEIISRDPDNAQARSDLADIYFSEAKLAEAEEQLREAIKIHPGIGSLHADLGHILTRKGDYHGALGAFSNAVDLQPDVPVRYYNMGDTHLALGNTEKAVRFLNRARQMDPYNPLIHYDLGRSFFDLQRYDECVLASEATLALQYDPEMRAGRTNLGLNATLNLGLANLHLKKYDEAKACFQRNLLLVAPAYFNLGLTLYREFKVEESLEYFKCAVELVPDDPEYLDLVGNAYMELKRLDEAREVLQKAIEVDDTYSYAHHDLGTVLSRMQGQEEGALESFHRAIELNPDYPLPYYGIACTYALQGKKGKALKFLTEAIKKGFFNKEKGFEDKAYIDADSDWDSMRDDKEFIKIMKKLKG